MGRDEKSADADQIDQIAGTSVIALAPWPQPRNKSRSARLPVEDALHHHFSPGAFRSLLRKVSSRAGAAVKNYVPVFGACTSYVSVFCPLVYTFVAYSNFAILLYAYLPLGEAVCISLSEVHSVRRDKGIPIRLAKLVTVL